MHKKVCFVSTTSTTMKCFIIPIAHMLTHENIDVTLICSDDREMIALCENWSLNFHPILMGRGIDISGFNAIGEIKDFFRREQFDLVQYCTPNAAFYASVAAILTGIPVRVYCQWGIRYVGLSGISRRIFKYIEKIVCFLSTDICAVSRKNKDYAVSEGLYKGDKAVVIGDGGTIGVDMDLFDIRKRKEFNTEIRCKYKIPKNALVFGFCGRLSQDKGANELLWSFAKVSSSYDNICLLIVGEVEKDTRIEKKLLNWAKRSGNVFFTGNIATDEIHKYYAPMDILVHPTYREGFGMVIQEAGAYGVPCITTKVPGASEVMEDNESCLLVTPRNIKELKDAMIKLILNEDLLRKLGEASYQRTRKLYDRMRMIELQKVYYLNLLGK